MLVKHLLDGKLLKMPQLNSLEIAVLVEECKAKAVDSFVRNVYDITPHALALKVFKPGFGAGELWTIAGYAVFYTTKTVAKQPEPAKQVLELRKLLSGQKITRIEQVANERIVRIIFEGYELIVECLPPGNIVLVKDDVIVWLLEKFESKDRVVRKGLRYVAPPAKPAPMFENVTADFLRGLNTKLSTVVALSKELGLGGKFAEEVVARAGIDKKRKIGELRDEEFSAIADSLKNLLTQLRDPRPRVYRRDGESIPTVTEFKSLEDAESIVVETFGEAALLAYLDYSESVKKMAAVQEKTKAVEKLVREKENRLYVLKEIEKNLQVSELFVEKVSKSLPLVDMLWSMPGTAAEEIRKQIGLEVHLLQNQAVLSLGDQRVVFKKDSSPYRELGKLFDELKTLRKTVEKLRTEVDELEKKIESLQADVDMGKAAEMAVLKPVSKPQGPFREFVTSGGFKVLSGKEAHSNIMLLKRHLEKNDLVLHTEIAGSPATVVKNGSSASEQDVEEAAQFTACYSRAWREQFSNISVYAVAADQISFTPPSGQFLPKGSFMVYGKKRYLVSELRLAVALLNGDVEVLPYLTAERRRLRFVEIKPGPYKAAGVARRIIQSLGIEPDDGLVDRLVSKIPYGKCLVLDNLINGR
ncbi:MAG: NFACT family protein [Candidatus Caldarchaeum sp.]